MFGVIIYGVEPFGAAPEYVAMTAPAPERVLFLSSREGDRAAVAASTEVATLPAGNLQTMDPQEKWRSTSPLYQSLVITLEAAMACDTIALAGGNFSSAALWRVICADNATDVTLPRDVVFDFLTGSLPSGATLARASTGWRFDATPALDSEAADAARFDYDPSTGSLRGLLNEPAATNEVGNASMTGTVAGTPGTAPSNWSVASTANGVTREIVGTGTEDGIPYIDIRYSGTPSATSNMSIIPSYTTRPAAAAGETWIGSVYLRRVGGSWTNASVARFVMERNSGGSSLASSGGVVTVTDAALRTQRFDSQRTLDQATTASVTVQAHVYYTNGLAMDVTLRVGLPQLVKAASAGSPIVTTAGSVARAADVLTLALANGTYDLQIVRASGTTAVSGAVVSGGTYIVPTDVSPVRSITATRRFTGAAFVLSSWASVWPASGKPTFDAPPSWLNLLRWTNTTAYRYWRLELSDPSTSYIEVGRLFIGKAFQPTINVDNNASLAVLSSDVQIRSAFGRVLADRRGDSSRRLVLPFSTVSRRETFDNLYELARYCGLGRDFFVAIDPAAQEDFQRWAAQALFESGVQFEAQPLFDAVAEVWRMSISAIEVI